MVSQSTDGSALQAQPAGALTAIVPVSPFEPSVTAAGVMVYVQSRLVWVTVNTCPAICAVPVRAVPALGWTAYETEPGPMPDDVPRIVSQATDVCAFHAQPGGAVTAIVPLPPVDPTVTVGGAIA